MKKTYNSDRPTTSKVSVESGPSRKSDKDLQRIKVFEPTVHPNPEQSASLIGKAMEFLGPSIEDGLTDDIIKVEVYGPEQPDLTLIDMPGRYFTEGTGDGSHAKDPGRLHMEKYMRIRWWSPT
ncbi:Dynamin [Penicillium fimorum]|uniref:Dynamin n=1 Tax=Penicillium fimorum TaxID=1882269 RepID=A0A9X0C9J2_9EURO|nr:Dynamin [Penicillium fimorum]